jgi:hypothetical protein
VAGAGHRMFVSLRLPGARQAPELALLSAAVRARVAGEAAGGRSSDQQARGGQPGLLRLPADTRPAQAPRSGLRAQDGVAHHAPAGTLGTTARRPGAGGRAEPAMGLRHHGYPGVGWTEGTLGDHHRLCGPDGAGVALRHADHGRGFGRDAAGGCLPAIWRRSNTRPRDRVAQRQWAGVYVASLPAVCAGDGADPVPYASTEPGIERSGGSVLRRFKRDYVYQACLETLEQMAHQVPQWIAHYNQQAPHSALGMRTPAECYAEWRVKNKTLPVQI